MIVLIVIGVLFLYMMIGIMLEILVFEDDNRSSIVTELIWPILLVRGLIFMFFSLMIFITDKLTKLFRK